MTPFRETLRLNEKLFWKFNQRWEFISEGGDVGFRVYCKKGDGSVIDLVPHSRVESHLLLEEGQISCDYTGKCTLFQNKWDWINNMPNWFDVLINRCGRVWQQFQLHPTEKNSLLRHRRSIRLRYETVNLAATVTKLRKYERRYINRLMCHSRTVVTCKMI